LVRVVNLAQPLRGLGSKRPTGQKSPPLMKSTRPKTIQKPYGSRSAHQLSS